MPHAQTQHREVQDHRDSPKSHGGDDVGKDAAFADGV